MTHFLVIEKTPAMIYSSLKKGISAIFSLVLLLALNIAVNGQNLAGLDIKNIAVSNETQFGKVNGSIEIQFNGQPQQARYKVSYDLHASGNRFVVAGQMLTGNKLVLNNMRSGQYFNLKVENESTGAVALWNRSFKIEAADFYAVANRGEVGSESLTCSSSISYQDCNNTTRSTSSSSISGKAYNSTSSGTPCGYEISGSCTVINVNQWHCIDGNLSAPSSNSAYTVTNYSGVGITALQACQINWVVCNYPTITSSVSAAIWKICGTGGSSNSIYTAAVAAVTVANGAQNSMVFYKSGNSSYQDMCKWVCTPLQCTGRVNSLYFNELNNGPDLPITNGATFSVAQLGSLYNMEAATSGTVGSVKFTITGPTASGNIENTVPYNSPGTGSGAWTGAAGNYSVNLKTYSGSNATGTLCHDTTITFILTSVPPVPLTLGNKVFFDRNRSGLYDSGDSVAAGIIVRLYNDANNDNVPDGAFIKATTTNGSGEYTFTNLTPGNYIVGVVVPPAFAITVINGGDPDNNIDNDNNAVSLVSGEARGMSITLSAGAEPTGGGNTNDTYDIGLYNPTLPPNGGQSCFIGVNPQVYAKSFWNVNVNSQTVTVRVTFSKSFTDNCYQPSGNADNWNRTHTFGNLTGSDHLQWSLKNGTGTEVLNFKQDYISANGSGYVYPSGYGTLGFSGDGSNPSPGTASDVLSFRTSISTNFNDYGYALTTNSPPTDSEYTANPAAPNWIYETWYEVTVKASVFGASGFGFVDVASVHSSPSKTGNNTEIITNTPCVGSIGDRVWYDTNRDGIQNAGENGISGVTVKLRNAANVVIATKVTNAAGNYLFTGLDAGTYTVEFPTTVYGYILSPAYVGTNRAIDSDPSVTTGVTPAIVLATSQNITTVDAGYAPDCACTNSTANLLTNASFENGTTGWNWNASNGSLTTGTGYIACGAANGFNNQSSGTSKVWQDVNVAAGATVTFSAFAGTHTPGISCSPKLSLIFLNASNAVISQTDVTVTRDVDLNNSQLEQYIITAVAPSGTVKARVQSSITCNTMKIDAFCLTVAPNCAGAGTWNLSLPNGTLGTSQAYTVNGITIMAYGFNNGSPGTATALYGKNEGVSETGLGINSDPDHEIDNNHFVQLDLNQVIAAGITSGTMTIGSMQAGEPASVYGSNTLGTRGTLLMTVPVTFDDTPFAIPAFPTYRYYSVQASTAIPANVLFEQVSFGCPPPNNGSIGDRVWVDTNKNGIQDAGEVGLAGVTVTLYDGTTNTVLASTVSDAYGNYLFSNLKTSAAGTNYQVRFSLVPGYSFSPNTGAVTVANNSDANLITGRTATVTLTNAAPNVTYVDAGMYFTQAARIGDFVWNDLNKNGIQDAGEPGIAGVTVMLYTAADVLYRSTVTSNNGYYAFNDVPAGSYYVKVAAPIGYVASPKNAGGSTVDSDIDPVTFKTSNITVVNGTIDLTIDAGFNVTPTTGPSASLGDRVWEDLNNNNIQDAGEPGIANVTVQLYSSANALLATSTTDAFGNYIFNGLTAGGYYVKFSLPPGFSFVTANTGTNDDIDSDADATTGASPVVTLVADEINTSVDAGMRRTSAGAALGDFVWYDLNKNGIQDGGSEVGVPGITVLLYNSSNVVVATTTTNTSGFYLFTGLPASTTYTVGFENLPAGYGFSPNAGAVTVTNNSDVSPTTGRTGTVTTGAAGTTVNYVDAGLIDKPNTFDSKSSVGDRVWNDLNNNGIQDAGEPGIAGVTVTLYAANGTTVVATTTTDALGNYLFTNLDAGSYIVGFSGLPSGYVFAIKDAGTDDSKDSDADGTTGKTAAFSLAAGEINLTIDAGARNATTTLSAIGNYVWYDVNGNGIQDATETGAAGVSAALKNSTGVVIKTTTTDANGLYLFTDVAAGTYTIQFGNLPTGYVATTKNAAGSTAANNSDADPTTLTTDNIVLPASTTDLTWDFGIKSTTRGSIGDFVWSDTNGDGIQQAGEPGVAGVTVTLYDAANNAVASTITDANGMYLFSNVLAGTYSVGFSNIPSTSTFTTQNAAGGTAATNSDADPVTGRTATFILAAGQSKTDVDAGLVSLKAAVGDYVWNDANRNGIQDINEIGVPGVTVTLYSSTDGIIGNGDDVAVGSAVTDANGYYLINNIPVSSTGSQFYTRYTDVQSSYVKFTQPLVGGTVASNNSKVTVQDITNGRTGFFMLTPSQVYRDMDAGVYKQINLSGNVWNDANGMSDGLVNSTSPVPIPVGLRVYLVNFSNGGIIERVAGIPFTTGTYNFNDVNVNTNYRVYLTNQAFSVGTVFPISGFNTLPANWINTGEHLGAGPGSDGIANGWLNVAVGTTSVDNANFGIKEGGGGGQQ